MINSDYVLIVDDSHTNNLLIKALLFENRIDSKMAFDASMAWDLISRHKPVLILLDLMMPKISGFQLLERLKRKTEFADIPIIVVSALCEPETVTLLKEMGAIDFFPKPIDLALLVSCVAELVKGYEKNK